MPRIEVKIYNTTTGDKIYQASAPDIDSAIAELGSAERAMNICKECHDLTREIDFCCPDCAYTYSTELQINQQQDEQDQNLHA